VIQKDDQGLQGQDPCLLDYKCSQQLAVAESAVSDALPRHWAYILAHLVLVQAQGVADLLANAGDAVASLLSGLISPVLQLVALQGGRTTRRGNNVSWQGSWQ
jgi:hypothetical protein